MTEPAAPPAGGPIGFIGLGAMGMPMARRLRDRGDELVVWSRTAAKAAAVAADNVRVVDGPAAVARACPVVVSCLLDGAAIESVYLGADGVIANAAPGALLVEHGTFAPALARRLAAAAGERRAQFLDAPVTGGAAGAAAGTLIGMVGGEAGASARLVPVASAYCASVERVGPSGAGVALKLVNQMLVAAHTLSAVEAAALVRAAGIPVEVADRVLNGGWAASAMLARNLEPAVTGRYPDQGATVGLLTEVLGLVRDAVAAFAIPTVVEPVVYAHFLESTRAGFGGGDLSALPIAPERPAGG
ncbi:NAD(P)-dependent oxidoreductase [Dactylosporangium sp. CA-092794]|uniref:NAD(P)-dependent oxidoreductase n=1 Tax=Dactylosporangium sp. CA-092794 TaxID=3239929 RepID=UPI003D9148E2